MPDTITGLSVLQPTWIDGIYRLWFTGTKADGHKSQGCIFIRDLRTPNLPLKMPDFPEGTNNIWVFQRNGDQLQCTPSVNWMSWGFHNAAAWSTPYVELTAKAKPYDAHDMKNDDLVREHTGHTVHYNLNNLPEQERPAEIARLRAEGWVV